MSIQIEINSEDSDMVNIFTPIKGTDRKVLWGMVNAEILKDIGIKYQELKDNRACGMPVKIAVKHP